jgi:hypothetical protein
VNKSAERVAADYTNQPEYKQNYKKGPEHRPYLPSKWLTFADR